MANGEARHDEAQPHTSGSKEVKAPLGTMFIVLVYGFVTVTVWGYMYYILLKSDGFLGGF